MGDPTNPDNRLQAGETKNKGVELEMKTRMSSVFDLIAHYNYTDVGKALEGLPRNQAAVWGCTGSHWVTYTAFPWAPGGGYLSSFRYGVGPRVPSALGGDALLAYHSQNWRYAHAPQRDGHRYLSILIA
ncbi:MULTISPECIES: TonB-dependent receptor domain-containing protein [unclassified Acidovorax]|uniref:TonB-dependent receptor domain-containing protein n=1 Tax=unclassified Acidovorax TaxID=2684926 RepID=UPI002882E048|nr:MULTISPECIES: TonB-dependent receptor [unclassified Acidovorax]